MRGQKAKRKAVEMKTITGFTKRIRQQHLLELNKRAEYLEKLWFERNGKFIQHAGTYLDAGCGEGENTVCFGRHFEEIYFLDREPFRIERCKRNFQLKNEVKAKGAFFLIGDVQALPFKDEAFDMVSMFSLVEHVSDQRLVMQEARRVLKERGQLIVQIPNRYFFLDLHTGLPFFYYIPSRRLRRWILKKLGYKPLLVGETPSRNQPIRLTDSLQFTRIHISRIVYPPELILPELRPIYSLLKALKLFNFVPFGWLFTGAKAKEVSWDSPLSSSNRL